MNKVVLMDFYADWCGPCKMQDPIIEALKEKFKGSVEFKKLDVDTNMDISNRYKILHVPTLVIERNGEIFKKYVGITRFNILEADLKEALK